MFLDFIEDNIEKLLLYSTLLFMIIGFVGLVYDNNPGVYDWGNIKYFLCWFGFHKWKKIDYPYCQCKRCTHIAYRKNL
jgi:hypothetical protein